MAEVKVDTVKLNNCGKEIMDLSIKIGDEINELFDRLVKMPTVTYEWTGAGAQAYANRAQIEKKQYIQLKDSLFQSGKYLVDCSNDLNSSINRLRRQ